MLDALVIIGMGLLAAGGFFLLVMIAGFAESGELN
jgi:hypothetical protein